MRRRKFQEENRGKKEDVKGDKGRDREIWGEERNGVKREKRGEKDIVRKLKIKGKKGKKGINGQGSRTSV
jgi:hypothetical protein